MNVSSVVASSTPVVEVVSVATATTCNLYTRSRTGGSITFASRSTSAAGNQTLTFPTTGVSAYATYAMDCTLAPKAKISQYRY